MFRKGLHPADRQPERNIKNSDFPDLAFQDMTYLPPGFSGSKITIYLQKFGETFFKYLLAH